MPSRRDGRGMSKKARGNLRRANKLNGESQQTPMDVLEYSSWTEDGAENIHVCATAKHRQTNTQFPNEGHLKEPAKVSSENWGQEINLSTTEMTKALASIKFEGTFDASIYTTNCQFGWCCPGHDYRIPLRHDVEWMVCYALKVQDNPPVKNDNHCDYRVFPCAPGDCADSWTKSQMLNWVVGIMKRQMLEGYKVIALSNNMKHLYAMAKFGGMKPNHVVYKCFGLDWMYCHLDLVEQVLNLEDKNFDHNSQVEFVDFMMCQESTSEYDSPGLELYQGNRVAVIEQMERFNYDYAKVATYWTNSKKKKAKWINAYGPHFNEWMRLIDKCGWGKAEFRQFLCISGMSEHVLTVD